MNSLAKTYCIVIELFQKGLLGTRIFYWTLAKNIEEKIYFHFCKKQKKMREKKKKTVKEVVFKEGVFISFMSWTGVFFTPENSVYSILFP